MAFQQFPDSFRDNTFFVITKVIPYFANNPTGKITNFKAYIRRTILLKSFIGHLHPGLLSIFEQSIADTCNVDFFVIKIKSEYIERDLGVRTVIPM